MRTSIINKIQKVKDLMVELQESLQEEIDFITEKMESLEEKSYTRENGEMTEKEQEKYDILEEEKEHLQSVINELECSYIFDEVEEYLV